MQSKDSITTDYRIQNVSKSNILKAVLVLHFLMRMYSSETKKSLSEPDG